MKNRKMVRLDDGTKVYDFIDKDGNIFAKVHIRPSDISFLNRKEAANEKLTQIGHQLEAADQVTDLEQRMQMFHDAEKAVVDLLNWLFDTADMTEVFKAYGPLAVHPSGRFFCTMVVEELSKVFEEAIAEEKRLMNDRVENQPDTINENRKDEE